MKYVIQRLHHLIVNESERVRERGGEGERGGGGGGERRREERERGEGGMEREEG